MVVLFAGHYLFDILAPGIDIIGVDVLRPYLAHLVDGSGGEAKILYGIVGPMGLIGVDIADKQVAPDIRE